MELGLYESLLTRRLSQELAVRDGIRAQFETVDDAEQLLVDELRRTLDELAGLVNA